MSMDKGEQQDIKPLNIIKQDVMLSGTTTASHHPMQTILSIPAHHNINNNNTNNNINNTNNNINNTNNNISSVLNNDTKSNIYTMSNTPNSNNNNNNGLNNQNNITFAENIFSTLQQQQLQQLQQHQMTATTDTSHKGVTFNHADLLNSLQNLQSQSAQQFLFNNSLQLPTSSTGALTSSNPVQHLFIPISLPTNQLNLLNGQLLTTPQQLTFALPNNASSQTLQPVLMVGPQFSLIMGQVGQNNQNVQNLALRQLVQQQLQQQQLQQQQQLNIINNNNITTSSMLENTTTINTNTSANTTLPTLFNNNNNNNNNESVATTPASMFQATSHTPLIAIANPQLLQQTLAAMVGKNLQHKIILSPNNNNNNYANNNTSLNNINNFVSNNNNISATTPSSTTIPANNNNNLLTTITIATSMPLRSSTITTMTTTTPTFTLPSGLKIITTATNNSKNNIDNIDNNTSKATSQVTQVYLNNTTQASNNTTQLTNNNTSSHQQSTTPLLLEQSSALTSSINQLLPNTISSNGDGTVIDGVNLDEMREFAKQFKLRRLSLGLTQTQVGQALSITEGPSYSQSAICRFEKLDITPKSAQKIKPVLERWMSMAEERLKMGGQALTDYGGLESSKKRKRRTSFTPSAIEALNEHFELNSHPTGTEMTTLADKLNFDREVIRVWFCNKRQTLKNTIKKFKSPNSPLS